MPDKSKTYFLTGATGLVGSYLTKILLENGHKVYALARPKNKKTAQQRVYEVLSFWDEKVLNQYRHNLIVFEGDITKANLGLNGKNLTTLKNEVEEIFHCAAVIEFNWPLEAIRKVNVEGTRNLLDIALTCKNLKKTNHISTAYVCGNHKGIFTEDDLDVGQGFNTTYEQSKFEAEKVVHEYRKRNLWIDVFRLPIVVGESTTGKVSVFQDFYKIIRLWAMELFEVFPGKEIMMNLISVDTACKAILAAAAIEGSITNHVYHLFNPEPISLREIMDWASQYLGFKKPYLKLLQRFNNNQLTAIQALLLKYNIFSYNVNVVLNSRKTNAILEKQGFILPKTDKNLFRALCEYLLKIGFLKNERFPY